MTYFPTSLRSLLRQSEEIRSPQKPVCRNSFVNLGLAASLLLLSTPLLGAKSYVYVESNIGAAGQNYILAFESDRGQLTPLPNSPFLTGGTGVFDTSLKLGPFDSDHEVIFNSDHTLLFAVNSGSNTIAVFKVKNNGQLVAVAGSPFPSRGTNPVALALHNDILAVVNQDGDPNQDANTHLPNYATLRVLASGRLIPTDADPMEVAYGTSPVDITILPAGNQNGYFSFGHEFLGGLLRSFAIDDDGGMTSAKTQALPEAEFAGIDAFHGPLGVFPHPYEPVVYVGYVTANKLGVYEYGKKGQLKFVRTVPNSGQALCWIRTNKTGNRIYTSNTGDNSISVYDSTEALYPVEIQHLVLNQPAAGLYQIELDANNQYLYVVGERALATIPVGQGNGLHVLKIANDGTLSEVLNSPTVFTLPAGTRPQGLAVN
jgi:DNA-binding beta-propeller fold protein YncE